MILDDIAAHKREEIAQLKARVPTTELEGRADRQSAPIDFAAALRGPGVSVIAEVKRASPSKGTFSPGLHAEEVAALYAEGGATAISVLTDRRFFLGDLEDLASVRRTVGGALPILRKDFLLDRRQVVESRAFGADAVLLIVRVLTDDELAELLEETCRWGMAALIEVHDEDDIARIARHAPPVVGINQRNLADFAVDRTAFARLRRLLPEDTVVVAASGIGCAQDVANAGAAGFDAVLVGEALVTASDPLAKVRELVAGGAG
jgi:indole-3-glycerol phosphate synthase